jgi:hypothetical protein
MMKLRRTEAIVTPHSLFLLMGTLAFLASTGQLSHPYVSWDDYEVLLPERFVTVLAKALFEGRWGHVPWAILARHMMPSTAYLLFILAYAAGLLCLVARAARPGLRALGYLALFFSPTMCELALWPATLAPSAILFGAFCAVLPLADTRRQRRGMLLAFCITTTFFYQMVLPLFLVVYAVTAEDESGPGDIIAATAIMGLGFGLGVFAVSVINFLVLGYFGIKTHPTRDPMDIRSLGDLIMFLRGFGGAQIWILRDWPLQTAGAVLCALALLPEKLTRQALIRLLIAGAGTLAFTLSLCLLSRTILPMRAYIWLWPWLCLFPFILALRSSVAPARWLGLAVLAIFAVGGLLRWQDHLALRQNAVRFYDGLIETARQLTATHNVKEFVVIGAPRSVPDLATTRHVGWFTNRALKDYGMVIHECDDDCAARFPPSGRPDQPIVELYGDVLVFRFEKL